MRPQNHFFLVKTSRKNYSCEWPELNSKQDVQRFGRTTLSWPNFQPYFPLVQKNIGTEQSSIQADNLEVSVRAWQETDGTLKLVIREEFNKGAIYKDVG